LDRDIVLKKCKEKGVILNAVGTQYTTSARAVELAAAIPEIYATVGLHPIQEHEVDVVEEGSSFTTRGEVFDADAYRALAKHPKVIAIGETGFDRFHLPKDELLEAVMRVQYDTFMAHARLAAELDLPLVFHVRDAHADLRQALTDLRNAGVSVRGVVHCFSGTSEDASWYVEYGLHLGFTGIVTFPARKSAMETYNDFQSILRTMPIERMLVETDAPFLAPQAYRGTRAEPWMVEEVVEYIAQARGIERGALEEALWKNSTELFTKMRV
jgi:TatD DNase family protein